jgi:hypothetical protein
MRRGEESRRAHLTIPCTFSREGAAEVLYTPLYSSTVTHQNIGAKDPLKKQKQNWRLLEQE